MKEYHDSLLSVQNILLSFKLVGETQEPEKSKMIEVMINCLVGQRAPRTAAHLPNLPHLPRRGSNAEDQTNGSARPMDAWTEPKNAP